MRPSGWRVERLKNCVRMSLKVWLLGLLVPVESSASSLLENKQWVETGETLWRSHPAASLLIPRSLAKAAAALSVWPLLVR